MIIADNRSACAAALWKLRKKLRSRIMSTTTELEAREMEIRLASAAAKPSMCKDVLRRSSAMIAGGECVVHLTGRGEGGRNQEVALAAVDRIQGLDGSVIAALGTDGIDGNTARRAKLRRLDPDLFLARNDSGNFFRQLGDALLTSPTGTNVGDIYLMISLS